MIDEWINNKFVREPSGVYRLVGHGAFSYSDGADSEEYLNRVFDTCKDLSSSSTELLRWIKDWRSEYHLSNKRINLLKAFNYRTDVDVLEVGSGCGAISRFLGETFNSVISVEGSLARAEIARKRCRDLSNVQIIAAPFQDISFNQKFDIIFCIGVLEYSSKFVPNDDPYNSIIRYFSNHLTENGTLVVAIENRLGLKYFNSASEDHTGRRFDGIEDYPGSSPNARTFGYNELREMLSEEFPSTEFFFPFPDYKVPDAIFSERLLEAANIGGLLGKFVSRDYSKPYRPLFSEKRAWNVLSENKLIHIFSNSFLIVASKGHERSMKLDGLGVIWNLDRAQSFHTRTKIYCDAKTNELTLTKTPMHPGVQSDVVKLTGYDERWYEGRTMQDVIVDRASSGSNSIDFIFSPAKIWYAHISALNGMVSVDESSGHTSRLSSYYDAIWQNTIVANGEIALVDQEWTIGSSIGAKQLLVRSIYTFLTSVRENGGLSKCLRYRSGSAMIKRIGAVFGESISRDDLNWLIDTESAVYAAVSGKRRFYHQATIKMMLIFNLTLVRYTLKLGISLEYLVFAYQLMLRILGRLRSKLWSKFIRS